MKTLTRCSLTLRAKLFAIAVLAFVAGRQGMAQAIPTASGPGGYVAVGGGVSEFQSDYGHRDIAGGFFYVDVNPQWRVGLEGEARFLRYHTFEDVTESNYLGGVRVAILHPRRWQPYGKFLAGVGEITLPFHYAHGSFLTYAPGAGLDIALNNRVSIRAVDLEYQHWPQFTYGALSPYGVSAGISVRLNNVARYPRSLRMRR
ncbi:MAG: outer membrane beta-barrel protein [Janthinobacterium lividum]